MRLDIRLPIGLMFGLFGLLLLAYGAFTNGDAVYQRSLGHNINLQWGAVLTVFGAVMLWLGKKGARREGA